MTIAITGLGWQATVHQQQRTSNEQTLADVPQFRPPVAAGNATAQQNSQGNTAQQDAEDAREEAFAKLKVQLQNPEPAASQQGNVATTETSSARQAFHDYMEKTPGELIKEKLLRELGLTEDEYNALPPEQRKKIDQQLAQRMQEDVEIKTQAKINAQAAPRETAEDEQDLAARTVQA
ncbi:hypothetical protein SE916_09695 [Pseudomonas sp. 5FOS]|uniref:hypothetical protein n=1 Tax=unclassified Pseudomonas TaxID=196821 RepID=UPI002FE317B1